jgi:hypothetical protein
MTVQASSLKFQKILLSLFSFFLLNDLMAFDRKSCLDSVYSTTIAHNGHPFGLTQNLINIEKDKCALKISTEKLKFLKKAWEIDVCRGPVHIKEGNNSVTVHKRMGDCGTMAEPDAFCDNYKTIDLAIQDYGLIFAKGEKEDLYSDHGKVYCASQLLDEYLKVGTVLSRIPDAPPVPVETEKKAEEGTF